MPSNDFHQVIDACNKFDYSPDEMWEFCILDNSRPVGYIPHGFFNDMNWEGTSFIIHKDTKKVHLNPPLSPGEDKVEVCKQQFVKLCENNQSAFNGILKDWLANPICFSGIRWLDTPGELFAIPSPLRGILGVATAGVHLNVFTVVDGRPSMWVAVRSESATYPCMMDQIVAGGMDPADGYDEWKTLQREAKEEASLILDIKSRKVTTAAGVEVGTVQGPSRITLYDKKDEHVGLEVGHVEPGVRFVFDLDVAPEFRPKRGKDKAVGDFDLKSVDEVKEDLLAHKWKPNSGLTTLDSLVRKGYVEDDAGDLRARLKTALPMATE